MTSLVQIGLFTLILVITIQLTHSQEDVVHKYGEFVPDEYIVTLRKDILSSKAKTWLQSFVTKIKDKYGCQVKRNFTFDKLKSFMIKGAAEKIQKLKELVEVAFIEKNIYVKAIQATNASVCFEENTGRDLWGLSRISRRDKMPVLSRAYFSWGSRDSGEGVVFYVSIFSVL